MPGELDTTDLERRMEGAASTLQSEFGGLRTGRASISLLDPIVVEAYGQQLPLNQVGAVGAPEARMLSVQVWDKSLVAATEKAIRNSGLGLNPAVDGTLIRLPIPELNEERRRELTKVAAKYTEQARIAVRNVRRDGMSQIKKMEKDSEIGQDEAKILSDDVQELTDRIIKKIDTMLETKDAEIMQV